MPHPHARGMPLRPRAGLHAAPRGAGRELHRRSQPTPEARPWARSAQHHSTGAQGPAGRPPFTTPPHAQHRALPPPPAAAQLRRRRRPPPSPPVPLPAGSPQRPGCSPHLSTSSSPSAFSSRSAPSPSWRWGPSSFPWRPASPHPRGSPARQRQRRRRREGAWRQALPRGPRRGPAAAAPCRGRPGPRRRRRG